MTDTQRKAELIRRLRIWLRLCQGDCTDEELLEFARKVRPVTLVCVLLDIHLDNAVKGLKKIGRLVVGDNSEAKYRALYYTKSSENASLRRRVARLKAENVKLRAASQGKSPRP